MIPAIAVLGAGLVVLERIAPARAMPRVHAWWPRAILASLAQGLIVYGAGLVCERALLAPLIPLGQSLAPWAAGLVAYLVSTFVFYWWHRGRHRIRWMWLGFHQMHHSVERLEVMASFYKHPAEQLANVVITAAIAFPLLGLSPEGAAIYTLLAGVAELFYHLNVRTPRWLGYVVQRPEMHRVHHARGHHAFNYADLPLWDLLFGTFHNPERYDEPTGFADDREQRVKDMLLFRDVNAASPPRTGRARRIALGFLVVLGLSAAAGSLAEPWFPRAGRIVSGVGKLSLASPAPSVFCKTGDEEPFAYAYEVEVVDTEGVVHHTSLDGDAMASTDLPYPTRNVIGAAVAFGSRLPRATTSAVLERSLCTEGGLARIGVASSAPPRTVTIRSAPRGASLGGRKETVIPCRG
jgi:sterol desaturase/sphingolipid hydroxylase (fatty acid hydroxylase superfamily)